jgi:thiol-disulfide isomerase/thioredoxin
MNYPRALPGHGEKMLKQLITFTLILLIPASFVMAAGQTPNEYDGQGRGQGRRHGRYSRIEPANPNIYNAPLPVDVNGSIWNHEKLEGKIVVLNFWATWCAPCLNQIPQVKKLYESCSSDKFLLLGVNMDSGGNRSLRRWLQLNRNKITWPQLFNRGGFSGALPSCYKIKDVPELLVFNRRGYLVHRGNSAAKTVEVVRDLLAGD